MTGGPDVGGQDLGGLGRPPVATDVRADVLAAARALAEPVPDASGGSTSDLSVDEVLLLHSIGWEPLDVVFGSGVASVAIGSWAWGQGEILTASTSYDIAFRGALSRLSRECLRAGGAGVVGLHVESDIERLHTDVELVGTAVGPLVPAAGHRARSRRQDAFASDLSARDFVLLVQAGWRPLGLVHGASFTYVPRRGLGTTIGQKSQNVELANYTAAMYSAREAAMGRLQDGAIAMGATGIVDVRITEGPLYFARHAIGFTAWGTAITLGPGGHRGLQPRMVLPLDDAVVTFEAAALRSDRQGT